MKLSIKRSQRIYFTGRLLVSFGWTVFWCILCYVQIEFFYGPGAEFTDLHPYIFGVICGVDFVGLGISAGYLLVRFFSLLGCCGRMKRSVERYLPLEEVHNPFDVLEQDVRCQLFENTKIYLGKEWIVFPGRAMRRSAVVGVFYEELYKTYLSRKVRLFLVDEKGREIYTDIPKALHPKVYNHLASRHPAASYGEHQALINFVNQQQKECPDEPVDYQRLRREVPASPISQWDGSAVLEDNRISCQYESWLLAAYSTYLAGDYFHDGDFSFAGGYERTALQKTIAAEVLEDSWEIQTREQLLETVSQLVQSGSASLCTSPRGWQLGRAVMLLGFGYLSELLSRGEMVQYSLDAALAIQRHFSSWEELLDSHMEGFEAWSRSKKAIKRRWQAYQDLLDDPSSVLNTVPFQSDLPGLYREAVFCLGIKEER